MQPKVPIAEAVEAGSGEEAIRLLTSGLAVQVVLTDMYMPAAELDGVGLARWIRDHRPEIKGRGRLGGELLGRSGGRPPVCRSRRGQAVRLECARAALACGS